MRRYIISLLPLQQFFLSNLSPHFKNQACKFVWPHKSPIPMSSTLDMTCSLGMYPIPKLGIKLLLLTKGVTLLSSYWVGGFF